MRIINIVTIKNNVVNEIESFPINDDQLSHDVIQQAENLFLIKARELGFYVDESTEEYDENYILDDGYYINNDTEESVCISWSYV